MQTVNGSKPQMKPHPHATAKTGAQLFSHWRANVIEMASSAGVELPADWFTKLPLYYRTGQTVEQAATALVDVAWIRSRAPRGVLTLRPGMIAWQQDSRRRLGGDNENTSPPPTERHSVELGIVPGHSELSGDIARTGLTCASCDSPADERSGQCPNCEKNASWGREEGRAL